MGVSKEAAKFSPLFCSQAARKFRELHAKQRSQDKRPSCGNTWFEPANHQRMYAPDNLLLSFCSPFQFVFMQAQPGNGLPGIADIIDRHAQVGDNSGILQEVQRMGGVDTAVSDVVAQGVHLDFFIFAKSSRSSDTTPNLSFSKSISANAIARSEI
jgi:hypothetical protein